jgi:hypothetical protein
VVALRARDIEALALAEGLSPADFIRQLEPAIRFRSASPEGNSGGPRTT